MFHSSIFYMDRQTDILNYKLVSVLKMIERLVRPRYLISIGMESLSPNSHRKDNQDLNRQWD